MHDDLTTSGSLGGQGGPRDLTDHWGDVLHALRNPVNVIAGFGTLLEDGLAGPMSELQRDYLRRMVRGGDRMLELLDEMQDLLQARTGSLALEPTVIHWPSLLQGVAADVADCMAERELSFTTSLVPPLPTVVADLLRLRHGLRALLRTVVETLEGPGTVCLELTGAAGQALVTIQAPGLTPAHLCTCAEGGRVSRTAGLGREVGLAMITAHGGQLWFPEQPDRVCFTLALQPPASPPG